MSRIVEALYRMCESSASSSLLNKSDKEIIDIFRSTMKDYVDEFYAKVTTRCKIPGKGISARFSTERPITGGSSFYMDYSCIYPSYSKETAKLALDIFKDYANIIIAYLEILKSQYPSLHYEVSKTIVSSARIGKGIYVYDFPFDLPDEYYEDGKSDSISAGFNFNEDWHRLNDPISKLHKEKERLSYELDSLHDWHGNLQDKKEKKKLNSD